MNTVTLREDVRFHAGVPLICTMSEMDAAFKQSLHRNYGHRENLLAFGLRSPHPRQRPRSFDPWHALEGPRACEIGIYFAYPWAGCASRWRGSGGIITHKNG